jgi:hypothetical protein
VGETVPRELFIHYIEHLRKPLEYEIRVHLESLAAQRCGGGGELY